MATMKTLNGYGFNATELNGKAASDYLQKTDTATNSAKLGGKAPEYYLQPRNLLDNSDFRNPVNQRGHTTAENAFIVDRWYTFNDNQVGRATCTPSGITLSGNSYLQQRLSKGILQMDRSYTIAVYYSDGTIDVGTNGSVVMGEEFDLVNNVYANGKTISHVALYEGSYTAETLPPYVPKGYAAELAECQRYFIADVGIHKTGTILDNIFEMYMLLPTQMRITPTAILKVPDNVVFNIGEEKIVAVKSASVTYFKNLLVGITLNIDSTGKRYVIGATYLTEIDLSADL